MGRGWGYIALFKFPAALLGGDEIGMVAVICSDSGLLPRSFDFSLSVCRGRAGLLCVWSQLLMVLERLASRDCPGPAGPVETVRRIRLREYTAMERTG